MDVHVLNNVTKLFRLESSKLKQCTKIPDSPFPTWNRCLLMKCLSWVSSWLCSSLSESVAKRRHPGTVLCAQVAVCSQWWTQCKFAGCLSAATFVLVCRDAKSQCDLSHLSFKEITLPWGGGTLMSGFCLAACACVFLQSGRRVRGDRQYISEGGGVSKERQALKSTTQLCLHKCL